MNIISCCKCGVVLDRDMMHFSDITDMENCAMWDDESQEWVSCVPCPVCKCPIKEK